MLKIVIIIISILSGFALFVPVFSGYLLALLMMIISCFITFYPAAAADSELKSRFYKQLTEVSRALLIFTALCGFSCMMAYILGNHQGKDLVRGYLHFLAKNPVMWFAYLSFYWRFASQDKSRLYFARSFALFSLINLFYCLFQRSFGIDWIHGFSAILPDNRLSNGVYRVSGFMGHPLTLGYCQALASLAGLGLGGVCLRKQEKIAWQLGAAAALIVVLISGSRGPQVVMLIGLSALFPVSILVKYWKSTLILAPVMALMAVKYGIFSRFYELSTVNLGGDMRMTHWMVYWRIFKDHFLFGIGPGGQDAAISAYYFSLSASDNIKLAHNAFLQYGAEYGLFGVVGLCVVIVSWIKLALRTVVIRRTILVVILATLLGALTQNNLQDSEYVLSFTIWLMLLVTLEVEVRESSKTRRTEAKDSLAREGVQVA
jgi:hypothetical protein